MLLYTTIGDLSANYVTEEKWRIIIAKAGIPYISREEVRKMEDSGEMPETLSRKVSLYDLDCTGDADLIGDVILFILNHEGKSSKDGQEILKRLSYFYLYESKRLSKIIKPTKKITKLVNRLEEFTFYIREDLVKQKQLLENAKVAEKRLNCLSSLYNLHAMILSFITSRYDTSYNITTIIRNIVSLLFITDAFPSNSAASNYVISSLFKFLKGDDNV